MVQKPENPSATGLQFFGKISASISHELKNVLAIINENAGLLEDLTLMADRGVPLDPARLNAMAEGVKKQIGRADAIIGNMNRFSHSADQTITTVDLAQTIELAIAVTARFAAMQGIKIDLQLPDNPVALQTAPFFLINLVWLCLEFAMSAGGDEKQIEVAAEAAQDGVRIRFGGLGGLSQALLDAFPSDREQHLLEMLAADLTVAPERQEIVLELEQLNVRKGIAD
jgi:C4-dicarboxylate-specific signal transduction histidine kinase